ncbi:MAG: hypothetical protein R3E02_04130 [Blastomonas sp.]
MSGSDQIGGHRHRTLTLGPVIVHAARIGRRPDVAMPLVETHRWTVERSGLVSRYDLSGMFSVPHFLHEIAPDLRFDRSAAFAGTVALHICLFLLLSAYVIDRSVDPSLSAEPVNVIAIVNSPAEEPAGAPNQPDMPAPPTESETLVEPLVPVEWSISSLRVTRSSSPGTSQSRSSGGTGGRGIYDPYAGASPQPLKQPGTQRNTAVGADINWVRIDQRIDKEMLENWLNEMRRNRPEIKGTIDFELGWDRNGKVSQATVTGADLLPQSAAQLARSIKGIAIATAGPVRSAKATISF